MSEDDLAQCECGCIEFTIARDGLIECVECRHPLDNLMAKPARVRDELTRRGVKIIEPEHYVH